MTLSIRYLGGTALFILSTFTHAQASAPGDEHTEQVMTVQRDGYTIAGLMTHRADAKGFKYGVALFPGHPGIMQLREEEGQPRFGLRGNFLVRSRHHWLDNETLAVVVDAPSDHWIIFFQNFRATPRYGADVGVLLKEIGQRYGISDWTLVGTSEGSVSAFHAARMNPQLVRRVILTASVFRAGGNGPGLSSANFGELRAPLLWVHHENDPCQYTAYHEARAYSRRSGSPLLTVRGGGPESGDPCQARTHHGFIGMEQETVKAMLSWVKTGVVPPDVTR